MGARRRAADPLDLYGEHRRDRRRGQPGDWAASTEAARGDREAGLAPRLSRRAPTRPRTRTRPALAARAVPPQRRLRPHDPRGRRHGRRHDRRGRRRSRHAVRPRRRDRRHAGRRTKHPRLSQAPRRALLPDVVVGAARGRVRGRSLRLRAAGVGRHRPAWLGLPEAMRQATSRIVYAFVGGFSEPWLLGILTRLGGAADKAAETKDSAPDAATRA